MSHYLWTKMMLVNNWLTIILRFSDWLFVIMSNYNWSWTMSSLIWLVHSNQRKMHSLMWLVARNQTDSWLVQSMPHLTSRCVDNSRIPGNKLWKTSRMEMKLSRVYNIFSVCVFIYLWKWLSAKNTNEGVFIPSVAPWMLLIWKK